MPRCTPLIQTSLFMYTPSNSSQATRSRAPAGSRKDLRYQPMPVGKKPTRPPPGASSRGVPSMLQSCGRSSRRHRLSSKSRLLGSGGIAQGKAPARVHGEALALSRGRRRRCGESDHEEQERQNPADHGQKPYSRRDLDRNLM